jgi:hypothetical protein
MESRSLRTLFSFPNPVNEVSARLVAGVVALVCAAILVFQLPLLMIPLAYGFWARALTGPTMSPLGQLVTRVVTPRLPAKPRPVPGPPKRFAQAIGATLSTAAVLLYYGAGLQLGGYLAIGAILVAATLESVLALCLGCRIFDVLMRVGLIPESVCAECRDISLRRAG